MALRSDLTFDSNVSKARVLADFTTRTDSSESVYGIWGGGGVSGWMRVRVVCVRCNYITRCVHLKKSQTLQYTHTPHSTYNERGVKTLRHPRKLVNAPWAQARSAVLQTFMGKGHQSLRSTLFIYSLSHSMCDFIPPPYTPKLIIIHIKKQ